MGSERFFQMNNYIFTRLKVSIPPLDYIPTGKNITGARQLNLRELLTGMLKDWQEVDSEIGRAHV